MSTPRRHGVRWSSQPTPLNEGAPAIALRGGLTPLPGPQATHGVIAVKELDAFLSALPRESITFLTKSQEVRYDHSLIVGQSLPIGTPIIVPQQYVWVLTDVEFYAYGPSIGIGQAPRTINSGGLVGLLRLDLLFSGSSPINSQSFRMSPYTTPGQTTTSTSGWPWLERNFGVTRMPSYALYAKENQTIDLKATVEDLPRFPISKVGYNLHGFSIPSSSFSNIWLK